MYFELKKSRLEITPRDDVTNSSNHPILSNFNWLTEITKKKNYDAVFCFFRLLLIFIGYVYLFYFYFFLGVKLPGKYFAFIC